MQWKSLVLGLLGVAFLAVLLWGWVQERQHPDGSFRGREKVNHFWLHERVLDSVPLP